MTSPLHVLAGDSTAARTPRTAVVLSHPTQYYSPWFRWLRAHTALEFRVFYLWKSGIEATLDREFGKTITWDVDLLGGYDSEFVPNLARKPGSYHFWGLHNPELCTRLAAWRPDAILLFGYSYRSHLRAIAWARFHRVPIVYRADSHLLNQPSPPARKKILLRALFRQFAAVTYVGAANRGYFAAFGVPDQRLFHAPHSVNDGHFNPDRAETRAAAQELRVRLGLASSARVILFAGKLSPRKQPRELLEAFLALDADDAALVFVGDGEQKAALIELARRAPPGRVHFLPFANQSEMPARYLMADIFVLPSLYKETWGLAVNEAMHMGIPCLVTDRVGCQRDLVSDGETGWVCRADDPAHLREKLATALAADLSAFRPRIARRIAGFTYATTSAGVIAALRSIHPDGSA